MRGCNADHQLEEAQFSKPLPWIGVYIAVASLFCALSMGFDAYRGVRNRKLWFPSRYFSLNATTLTILAIAAKLPVDLNTSMPGRIDQLSKLSGTVFLCTVMGNIMPSLGDMSVSDIASNVVALGILVVTVAVNVGIQMGTGVIYVFLPEHAIIMFFMLVLLVILAASALPVPTTKHLLNEKFNAKFREMREKSTDMNRNDITVERLKESINKFWLMAHTASPQFVMGRSATCTASGAFCVLAAVVLIEAFVRSHSVGTPMFCRGGSDYKWSTTLIFVTQAVAIFSGTFDPACRWFNAISFRNVENGSCRNDFTIEKHWLKRLKDWREAPLPTHIGGRRRRKLIHNLKDFGLLLLVQVQKGVILLSKLVRLLTVWPLSGVIRLKRFLFPSIPSNSINGSTTSSSSDMCINPGEFKSFVLHLDGEDDLVDLIMRSGRKDTEKWILKGKKERPTKLIEFITKKHSAIENGFKGVALFDRSEITSLVDPEKEPPNCWALPIVTLASIAVALPVADKQSIMSLLEVAYEGLRYVRFIEKYLDGKGLVNMREAADVVWNSVDVYNKWFDMDLRSLHRNEGSNKSVVEKLQLIGKKRVETFWAKEKDGPRKPIEWPAEVLAANCMYRVTTTILQDYNHPSTSSQFYPYLPRDEANLFKWLEETISDTLRACFTNLPRAIYMECLSSSIEVREQRVRNAVFLLGEVEEEILKILGNKQLASSYPGERQYLDEWRKSDGSAVISEV